MTTPLNLEPFPAEPVPESPTGRVLRDAADELAHARKLIDDVWPAGFLPEDSTVAWLRSKADAADRDHAKSPDVRAMAVEPLGVVGHVTVLFDVEKGHEPGSYDEPGGYYLALRRARVISHDLVRHAAWLADEAVETGDADPDGSLLDAIRGIGSVLPTPAVSL